MFDNTKILHYKHTGRLRPHEFTSYLPLAILVFITGLALLSFSFSSVAADHPGPQSGSIGLTGEVPGSPPKVAAVISSPTNGQHFIKSPVTISGTCPDNTLVEIYKNNIFAGSTFCTSQNNFSMDIDLLFGKNVLVAQVYDPLNQAGPASNSVTIYYDAALPQAAGLSNLSPDLSGAQLLLDTDAVYRGTFPGQSLNVPVSIIGGTPPYALNVEWGDSNNKVIPRSDNLTFNATHTYDKAGTFGITLQATDSKQRTAFLTVAAIVNGQPAVTASVNSVKASVNKLLVLWPLYAICATLVVSFWLGERREKKLLGPRLMDKKTLVKTAANPPVNPPAAPTPSPQV